MYLKFLEMTLHIHTCRQKRFQVPLFKEALAARPSGSGRSSDPKAKRPISAWASLSNKAKVPKLSLTSVLFVSSGCDPIVRSQDTLDPSISAAKVLKAPTVHAAAEDRIWRPSVPTVLILKKVVREKTTTVSRSDLSDHSDLDLSCMVLVAKPKSVPHSRLRSRIMDFRLCPDSTISKPTRLALLPLSTPVFMSDLKKTITVVVPCAVSDHFSDPTERLLRKRKRKTRVIPRSKSSTSGRNIY